MTTITSTSGSTTRIAPPFAIGALVTAVAIGLTAYSAHGTVEAVVVGAGLIVVGVLVYGLVVPRSLARESAGGTALAFSVPALLMTLPFYWTGLPLVLGVAGALIGNAGRTARTGAGKCIAALVIGSLAALGYLTIYVVDGFILGNH